MARAVTTIITCDLCAGTDHEKNADNTYSFQYSNTNYEIDLCAEHGAQFESEFSTWIGLARRIEGRKTRRSTPHSPQTRNLKEVRSWAKNHGFNLGDRGRIPREVLDAYDTANTASVAD